MSREIRVNTKRTKQAYLSNIRVRLDNVSPVVIAGAKGAIPYNSYMMYSLEGTPDIRNGDLLVDIASADQYRVSGNVEVFDYDHIEGMVEKVTGITP